MLLLTMARFGNFFKTNILCLLTAEEQMLSNL
jgi:hypothetical protein